MVKRLDSPIYHCHNCKKIMSEVTELLFVEENSSRSFCSEECIDQYFSPMAKYYQEILYKLRDDLGIDEDHLSVHCDNVQLLNETCSRPNEMWHLENKIGDEVFVLINECDGFHHIVLCTLFNRAVSYIFLQTATSNPFILEQFRIGESIEDIDSFFSADEMSELEEMGINDDVLVELERKKSTYLAELMVDQLPSDIQMENFHLYEPFFEQCLEDPDEIYQFKDQEGDEVYSHIKACENNGQSFFYIIVFMTFSENEIVQALPIISVPTLDGSIVEKYRQGTRLMGSPVN